MTQAILLLVVFGCQAVVPPAGSALKKRLVTRYFSLNVPTGVKVSSKTVVDFDLFEIRRNGVTLLGIYLGDHPAFPINANNGSVVQRDPKVPDKEVVKNVGGHSVTNERLLVFDHSQAWPTYLHAWVPPLDPTQLDLAREMLASVAVARRKVNWAAPQQRD